MHGAGTVPIKHFIVEFCAVALVLGKLILGVLRVQHLDHITVTADLCQHARRGDRKAHAVPADDQLVRRGDARRRAMVAVAVDERVVRRDLQRVNGELHRLHACAQNVRRIDLACVDGRDGAGDSLLKNNGKKRFALFLRQLFRVVQPLDLTVFRQDNGGGVHRPHQRPRACLVHAADKSMARRAGLCLIMQVDAHALSPSGGSSSVKRPSLPPRNSSSRIRLMRSVSTSPPEIKNPRLRPAFSSSA